MLAAISDSSPMIAIIFSSELERRDRAGRSGASGDDMSPSGALPGPGRTERLPAVPPEPTNEDAQVFYTGTGSQGRCGHVSKQVYKALLIACTFSEGGRGIELFQNFFLHARAHTRAPRHV